ncbi:MAG: RsmE family RNA methyltransferase [Bacteroidota bacterium]|nr:RsmE family RNA methyltransferase [Bacteroidota bacterium]
MHLFLITDFSDPTVRADEHRHLSRVLRLRAGDAVLLTAGEGRVAEAVIEDVAREDTRCRVTAVHEAFNEPPVDVTLCQGVLKNHGKLDWLVEKGTELGMHRFMPLLTEHCVAQSVRGARLQKLAETAAKQCMRGRIPEVQAPQHLTAFPGNSEGARLLLFHESAPRDAVPEKLELDARPLALLVGPEGGFSPVEVDALRAHGAEVLSLGPRRLRGETAGLAALTRIMAMVENGNKETRK